MGQLIYKRMAHNKRGGVIMYEDEYECQCDICTGNIDSCAKCGKAVGGSEIRDGLCRDCQYEEKERTTSGEGSK